jgi:hypothetical protein
VIANAKAYSLEEIRKKHPRAYERWTPDEEARLVARFEALLLSISYWKAISRLSTEFGRRRGGIRSRLLRLGVEVPALRPRVPDRVRQEVWARDGGMCVDCGSRDGLQFDHVIPVSKGGATTAANIELRCSSCNVLKGDLI